MILTAIKEFCIQYDEQLAVLRVEWNGQRTHRFRQALKQLQSLTKELRVHRVLLELNSLPDISVYNQLWLSAHFMPSVLRLPLEQVVIILASKHIYNQQVVEELLMAAHPQIRFDVQFFAQPDSALYWLTSESPRLPVLLAEWDGTCGHGARKTGGEAEPLVSYHLH